MLDTNRWRGSTTAEEPGCYVHYLPAHGPNIYDREASSARRARRRHGRHPLSAMGGRLHAPFEEKIGVEWKDTEVVAVHGKSREADILREMLVGGKVTRARLRPQSRSRRASPPIRPGSNSPGALHFGIDTDAVQTTMRRLVPNWEEPPMHLDLATFDTTVKLGNTTLIDNGFLMALRARKWSRRPGATAIRWSCWKSFDE